MSDWQCARSGDCCRHAGAVVMTPGELAAVRAVTSRPHLVTETGDGRVEVSSVDGGLTCAFYADGCTVYAVRPGVCRAYGCFRRPGEAYTAGGNIRRIGESAGVRRVALRLLTEAEAWTASCAD